MARALGGDLDRVVAPLQVTTPERRVRQLVFAVLAAAFALKLVVVLGAANRGFEMGDEGYFLLNFRHPDATPPPVEVYRILGRMCGGGCEVGVVRARLLRIAAELAGSLALIGGVFIWARARVFRPGAVGFPTFLVWCLQGALISVASRSLGYNDMGNFVCFAAVGALFLLASLPDSARRRRMVLALAGGALTGCQIPVKWPSAVLLAAAVSLVLAFGLRSLRVRERLRILVVYASGIAAVAGLAVLAEGGPEPVAARIAVALEFIGLTAHEPAELLRRYVVVDRWTWANLALFLIVFLDVVWLGRRHFPAQWDRTLAAALGLAAVTLLAGALGLHPPFLHWSLVALASGLLGLSLLLVASFALAARAPIPAPDPAGPGAAGGIALPLVLLALPFVLIAGTNVPITTRFPTHALPSFVLIAVGVLGLRRRVEGALFESALAAVLVAITSLVFVWHDWLHPYGLARPIHEQRFEVKNLPGVRVDVATRDFLEAVAAAMGELGFRVGDPVIAFDYLPGLVYYLGGTSPRYNLYVFDLPAYNCYNVNHAELNKPPLLILAQPMSTTQQGCLEAIHFPDGYRWTHTIPFPYEDVYAGFGASGFSKLFLVAPKDAAGDQGR